MTGDEGACRDGEPVPAAENSVASRELLERLGIAPSKARGQNFLHDTGVIRRIAQLTGAGRDNLVVEVGPGLGALTTELDRLGTDVIAVEVDSRLADYLRQRAFSDRVTVVEADALATDSEMLTGGRAFTLAGNLPYSIATAILEHFLDQPHMPSRLVTMVQREVAQRMVAQPPQMSVLAVAMQFYGRPKIAMRVGSGAFIPAPTIESAVVVADVEPAESLDVDERRRLFRLVRAGFSQRRKRLGNALAATLLLPKSEVNAVISEAGIDAGRRAETISVSDWLRLYHAFGARLDADD